MKKEWRGMSWAEETRLANEVSKEVYREREQEESKVFVRERREEIEQGITAIAQSSRLMEYTHYIPYRVREEMQIKMDIALRLLSEVRKELIERE